MRAVRVTAAFLGFLLSGCPAHAIERIANTPATFLSALRSAQPGDSIALEPGVYEVSTIGSAFFQSGLTDVVIHRRPGTTGEVVFRGGLEGLHLSDATNVTLENLVFEGQTGNGINIDDGGSFATPTTGVTIRNVTVRDMQSGGNSDGIKLSGVTGFVIDRVVVQNWGGAGSAIDPVGSHNGLIVNSVFQHATAGNSGVRPKGGSKNIRVLANRFEMPQGAGRAIQAGGSTDAEFFRFIEGDSGYEAREITAAGNLIVDAQAALSYVNIDGGEFHHNWLQNPRSWAARILNENPGSAIVDTRNGVFADNVIEYDGGSWNRPVNVGPETEPQTFTFARNQWNNTSGPTSISLPVAETGGVYGSIHVPRTGDQVLWGFAWGKWMVNASLTAGAPMAVPGAQNLLVATAGLGGEFNPSAADPFSGAWTFGPAAAQLQLGAQDNRILIRPNASAAVPNLTGDFDRSGAVDQADYLLWKQQFGAAGPALADGNSDGRVDAADYTLWRDALSGGIGSVGVPEPSAPTICGVLFAGCWWVSHNRRRSHKRKMGAGRLMSEPSGGAGA